MSSDEPVQAWSRYTKIRVLGHGSFGQVYLAKPVAGVTECADEVCVVKRTSVDASASSQLMEANATEVYVLGVLQHPNIVRYIEHFVDAESTVNLVTEYCCGGDLQAYIDTQSQGHDTGDMLYLLFQLLVGVGYMHISQVMHRDLKPSNIFLCEGLLLKIGDFGISKMLSSQSMASTMVGTPFYLSPEVCNGQEYTHPADMWSLGCVAYEMFALRKPFGGNNILAVAQAINSGKYADLPDSCPGRVKEVVASLLRVAPEERATAAELLEKYFAFTNPLPTSVCEKVISLLPRPPPVVAT